MPDRNETLERAIASALNLAELTERKAGLLRDMAEALAAERWPMDSAWHASAANVAATMERDAARRTTGQARPYAALDGRPIACAYVAGGSAWTYAGQAIPRRQALGLIAERMKARLS